MRIDSYKVLFWDFDGVIKDSIDVKTEAFVELFEQYGSEIMTRIKAHHLAHGGMSRFEKIPLYARWTGHELSDNQVQEYAERFSKIVFQGVVDSFWVPGVERYLRKNDHKQIFVLVSATPHDELNAILKELSLRDCFKLSYGSPTVKNDAIANSITSLSVRASDCLMIGDAQADLKAAYDNRIDFLLRRHSSNESVFNDYNGPSITDFRTL